MKKIIMGLSGGMDSATLLGVLLSQGYEVHCCSFLYGSKHMAYEAPAAKNVVEYYVEKGCTVHHHVFDLRQAFQGFNSALMQTGPAIPEGHYNEESMKATVVPGRNLIFSSIMAGLAESLGAEAISLGVHSGDHHIYPDCRPNFIKALNETVQRSTESKVSVIAPFLNENKTSIIKIGYSLPISVPYHLTRTCYKNQELSCGKCGSCRERRESFDNLGLMDPIDYEEDERDVI